MIRIAVFGSSTAEPNEREYNKAYALGMALAQNRWEIVCGGYAGTMEALAKGSRHMGGKSIGIAVEEFKSFKSPNDFLSETVFEAELFQRTRRLIDSANAIVLLDGNLGTLFELLGIWTLMQCSLLPKDLPVLIASPKIQDVVEYLAERIGRDATVEIGRFVFCESVEEIMEFLKSKFSVN